MSDDELWRDVGRLLRQTREDSGWRFPVDVYNHGGPHNNVVTKHERGKVSSVSSLAKHAAALHVSVTDLFRSALDRSPQRLTPQARRIGQQFDALGDPEKELVRTLCQRLQRAPTRPSDR